MKYIDLYAGIGGFRQALDKLGHECVFSAEIDSSAIQTYEENYKDLAGFDLDTLQNLTDKEINSKIPDHNLLVGGFPCQPFSVGGKRLGFKTEDTKGTQFFNILKIIDVKKPKYIFLENVKNLFTHDGGNTWLVIKTELEKRGYQLPEKEIILSPVDFGIPQNRNRVFIIGYKGEKPDDFKFKPATKFKNILVNNKDNEKYVITKELNSIFSAWEKFVKGVKFPEDKTLPVIWVDELRSKSKIQDSWPKWKQKYVKDMREFYADNKDFIDSWFDKYHPELWSPRDKKLEWQAGKDNKDFKNSIITLRQSGIRCKAYPIYPTLVAMVQTPIIFDKEFKKWRFITPREAGNLQSFPSSFKINPTDSQAYKQFGNAVNVKVIEELAKYYFDKK